MRPLATKRPFTLLLSGLGLSTLALTGCQRSVNSIGGPYAPAGSSAPVTGAGPLIPLGPITGGTRVPPPSTGSSNLDNSYSGTGAPNTGAGLNSAIRQGDQNYVAAPSNAYRDSLGGMPIQDLSAQLTQSQVSSAPMYPTTSSSAMQNYGAPYGGSNSQMAVGSGLAAAPPTSVSLASATSFTAPSPGGNTGSPADRMRPIDSGYSVTPPPRYRAIESTISTAPPSTAQPVASRDNGDSWQSPSSNVSSQPSGVANAVYTSPKQPTSSPTATGETLPWRSPTLAR